MEPGLPNPLRVVFDTSVLVSVVGRPAGNYSTWKAVLDGELVPVVSNVTLEELRDVLARPRIREHYGTSLDPVNVDRFIAGYKGIAIVVPEPKCEFVLHADPKDSPLFQLAIEARADFFVTYDEVHVLAINRPDHPQHLELKNLAPQLRILKPADLAMEISRIRAERK